MWPFKKKKPKEVTEDIYRYPFGSFTSWTGSKVPNPYRLPGAEENFKSRMLNIAEAMVNSDKATYEDLLRHFNKCRFGSQSLTDAAKIADKVSKTKQELLENTRKFVK